MRIRIDGHHLPGRSFGSLDHGHTNVHVALQVRSDPFELIPGDAETARWEFDVQRVDAGDAVDFRGPAVQGRRGERFLYLTWGDVDDDGAFAMFRRAKLMLGDLEVADLPGDSDRLVATVHLTDELGHPRCARLRPPAIEWSVQPID